MGEGRTTSRPATLVDLYPTLLDLAGLPPASDLDGASLSPLLLDTTHRWKRAALTTYPIGSYAVRDERWRYIRYRNGDEELYDHEVDPGEEVNLAGDTKFNSVKTKLAKHIPAMAAPNAPVTFYPDDLKGTVKHLVRFFEPEKLIEALEPVVERRERKRQERKQREAAAAQK